MDLPSADALVLEETPRVELFEAHRSSLRSAGFSKADELLDLSALDMGYSAQENFSYPDWKIVRKEIQKLFLAEQWAQAWREIGIKWVHQLKKDIGGQYNVHESWNFILLSAESKTDNKAILNIAEYAALGVENSLGKIINRSLYGKRVMLVFSEEDDYYAYASGFQEDGHYARSGGVFISKGYGHIALPFVDIKNLRRVVTHELTHNCLMELRLPTWLNEGVCRKMERMNSQLRMTLDEELAVNHRKFWNRENIQRFWAGTSFYGPGEENVLSYSLGEIIVELLSKEWPRFLEFVREADIRDAGQDAALRSFDKCLGETVSVFLGPGEWRPNRKRISELWRKNVKVEHPSLPV